MKTALIDTGCANLASVRFALDRLGDDYAVVRDPDEARDALRLILPGVGAADAAMASLNARGWTESLRAETRPVLGICLGMQLLFERSDEGEAALLGCLPGRVKRLPVTDGLTWPHMGWNTLTIEAPDEPLLAGFEGGEHVYFVHGFYAPKSEFTRASTEYGADVSAVVRRDNFAGCQFHPERSAATGARILANFLESRT